MVDSLLEIITATGIHKFYKPIEVYSVTNAIDQIGVSMIFLVVTFYQIGHLSSYQANQFFALFSS